MAVYTHLSDSQINQLLSEYAVGGLVSAQPIEQGVENSNYLLTTTEDKFILTLYEKRVDIDDLPFFLGLKQHLAENGVKCPQTIKRNDGQVLSEAGGRKAALISFLNGKSVTQIKDVHLYELGKVMAQMHLAAEEFELSRQNNLSPDMLSPLFANVEDRLNDLSPDLKTQLAQDIDEMQSWSSFNLPRGIIHADLFADNVFFIDDKLTGIIDFYFACEDYLVYDLAIVINAWCFDNMVGDFNPDKARALFDGYNQLRQLNDSEKQAMPKLARGAALRFLLTRANDLFFQAEGAVVTPHDPAEYVAKWKFHNSVKHAREYGL